MSDEVKLTSFIPEVIELGKFNGFDSIGRLSEEVSVYAASPAFVNDNCGPIAKYILSNVPQDYFDRCEKLGMKPNIDVRVHRLNVGEFPAVPGWHCDGVMRETYFSSPDIERIRVRDTVLATVSSHENGVSNFEFLTEGIQMHLNDDEDGLGLWGKVNNFVEKSKPEMEMSKDGILYQVSSETIHRCSPAKVRGWRLFFRMSMWHNDYLGDEGKISTQQQVYIKDANGW